MKKTRIAVGLSGGVDSSVAAKLLLDQGHEVVGIFMRNWEDDSPECTAPRDALDAERVAKKLKIPFHEVNFSKEYWHDVFAYFLREHKAGRTPNPDILCNKFIKFGSLLDKAKELGADFLATGHYARKTTKSSLNSRNPEFELRIPEDKNKDQTYFLHALNQEQLASSIFPLENLKKSEVRRIAREADFPTAEKKDSTGICFIGERNYRQFLQKFLKKRPGKIIEAASGKVLGEHVGVNFYTIGQRRDLKIGGVKNFSEAPWFVVGKNQKRNELIVSQDEKKLLATELMATNVSWISGSAPAKNFKCGARIRYRSEIVPCTISCHPEECNEEGSSKDSSPAVRVQFKTPVRAITPGQSVVFYDHDVCLGGGEIQ